MSNKPIDNKIFKKITEAGGRSNYPFACSINCC